MRVELPVAPRRGVRHEVVEQLADGDLTLERAAGAGREYETTEEQIERVHDELVSAVTPPAAKMPRV